MTNEIVPYLVDYYSPLILEDSLEEFSDQYEMYWREGTCTGCSDNPLASITSSLNISQTRRLMYLTCFRLASLYGRVDLLRYLEDHQAGEKEHVTKTEEDIIKECKQDCLFMAIIHGRVNVGCFLIEQRLASADEPFRQSPSLPLHQAISSLGTSRKGVDFVHLLLIHGADVCRKNHQGDTALHVACQTHSVDIVRLLVEEYGADLHTLNNVGRSPLFLASAYGQTNICGYLLEKGADLHYQEESTLYIAVEMGNLSLVQVLMDYKPDPWVRCGGLKTSAEVAISTGNLELIKSVLQYDTGVHRRLAMDRTLLHCAARLCHPEVLRWLLEQGFDPNIVDQDCMTAAHVVCCETPPTYTDNVMACLQALHDFGATFSQYDLKGRLPIHVMAACQGCVSPFLHLGFDSSAITNLTCCTPLHVLCTSSKCTSSEVMRLLAEGVDINATDCAGVTPIMESVVLGSIEIVDLLIRFGADILRTDLRGRNALHHICRRPYESLRGEPENHELLFRIFLQKIFLPRNGDINQGTRLGLTALHFAVFHGRRDQVEFLLELGADMNRIDSYGRPPLHFVGRTLCLSDESDESIFRMGLQGSSEKVDAGILEVEDQTRSLCYQTLLNRGADTTVVDQNGCRCFFLAASTGWLSATFELLHASAIQGLFEPRKHMSLPTG